jgi:hypothetical protein
MHDFFVNCVWLVRQYRRDDTQLARDLHTTDGITWQARQVPRLVVTTEVSSLSRLRGRVGEGEFMVDEFSVRDQLFRPSACHPDPSIVQGRNQ